MWPTSILVMEISLDLSKLLWPTIIGLCSALSRRTSYVQVHKITKQHNILKTSSTHLLAHPTNRVLHDP